MSYLCVQCSTEQNPVEFEDRASYMDHMREHKEGKIIIAKDKEPQKPVSGLPQAVKVEPPKVETPPAPLKLGYLWEGQCPDCRGPIDTLMIDVGTKTVAVAYCNRCKKQKAEKTVVKLSKS